MEPTESETKKEKRREEKKRGGGDVANGLNGGEKRGKHFFSGES